MVILSVQGESLASAFENVVRASYLNVTKHLPNSVGPQFLLQTALYARIGMNHLKPRQLEMLTECGFFSFSNYL